MNQKSFDIRCIGPDDDRSAPLAKTTSITDLLRTASCIILELLQGMAEVADRSESDGLFAKRVLLFGRAHRQVPVRVWTILRDGCLPEKEPWAEWLHHPADLTELLPDDGPLTLPLNDTRVWPWTSSPWPEE